MPFFTNENKLSQENNESDEVKILYSDLDGWSIQTDLELLADLHETEVEIDMINAVSDFIANQKPGSWMKLQHSIIVILGDDWMKLPNLVITTINDENIKSYYDLLTD